MDFGVYQSGHEFYAYNFFGAIYDGQGTQFRTHAPNARNVYLSGDFNNWANVRMTPVNGVWELYVANAKPGDLYKYRIQGPHDDRIIEHSDPYGYYTELRPKTASVVYQSNYKWKDQNWLNKRTDCLEDKPVSVYELHLGSWRTKVHELGDYTENGQQITEASDNWYSYREIAQPLAEYVLASGFTHIEVLPILEHPLDMSWGYLPLGFFSPTSRYGSPDDLRYFIDVMHQHNIGVIIDFVPVHFPTNDYGLANYDGTAFYEYPYEELKFNEWGSLNFNLMKGEVRSFLNSSAMFWIENFHVDGLRLDAVSSLIYYQGNKNLGTNDAALEFIRNFNQIIHEKHPDVMTVAEDSSDFPNVTNAVKYGGLGFTYKWDMGWMNDTLNFFKNAPWERRHHYNAITFSMMYFYSEKFMLPFSHDEVVHGDLTIADKPFGTYEEKFPQARSIYMYMFAHPGKKLNFMGNEFAQLREWDEKREQDWELLTYPIHAGFYKYFTDLNKLYVNTPALYKEEYYDKNYSWTIVDDWTNVVYAFRRGSGKERLWFIFNFSGEAHLNYEFKLEGFEIVSELINSDWQEYGGNTPRPKLHEKTWQKVSDNQYKIDLAGFNSRAFKIREKKEKQSEK